MKAQATTLLRGQLTLNRLLGAAIRRIQAIPVNIEYAIRAGPDSENHNSLIALKDTHQGARCFVLGNGPSLAKVDLGKLASELTFGLNRISLLFSKTTFRPTYYVCMNALFLQQSSDEIAQLDMPSFLNWRHRRLFDSRPNVSFMRESFRPHFSNDITRGVWSGATVTFVALQIAYHMGFTEVVLLGIDHEYSAVGTPHSTVSAQGSDRDHFHPKYFSDGYRWQLPDLSTSEIAYEMARVQFESDGRRILDATRGGKLEVFPKVNLEKLIS